MKLSRLLNESIVLLKNSNIEDPALEAGLILSWALGKPSSFVYAYPDTEIGEPDENRAMSLVKRRCKGEPFQYITGECEFLSLKFKVNPNVLIPRADTEILAEAAIYSLGAESPFSPKTMFRLGNSAGPKRALDIGTGSGCLAVAIAYSAGNVEVDAVDISEEAIECAKENADQNGVLSRVRFIRSDILHDTGFFDEPYDLIVSNPPYIPGFEEPMLPDSVRNYEPHSALFAGNDGFAFFERIAFLSGRILKKDGVIAVECGYNQAGGVQRIFSENNMETVVLKDLAGIDRVIAARFHV